MNSTVSTHRRPLPSKGTRLPVLTWFETARGRRHLARLDDAALADIGLTRTEALAEARRPFWDID